MKIPSDVSAVLATFPAPARDKLLAIRELIFDVALNTPGVGQLTETLKWGEPSYLTNETKSGTTVRLGWKRGRPDVCFVFVNCQTTLIQAFRDLFSEELAFEGKRAIVLPVHTPFPVEALRACLKMALTYHLVK